MFKWTSFGLIAALLTIVVVGIATAAILAPDDLTRQIAIFAAIVALGGLLVNAAKNLYDIWDKERERKKKDEEGKERVVATFIHEPRRAVKIVNKSKFPLHIASVQLRIKKAGADECCPLQTILRGNCLPASPGQLGQEFWQLRGTTTYDKPLQIGEPCIFVLSQCYEETVNSVLSAADTTNAYITVHSHIGELHRVEGEELHKFLRELANEWKKPDAA